MLNASSVGSVVLHTKPTSIAGNLEASAKNSFSTSTEAVQSDAVGGTSSGCPAFGDVHPNAIDGVILSGTQIVRISFKRSACSSHAPNVTNRIDRPPTGLLQPNLARCGVVIVDDTVVDTVEVPVLPAVFDIVEDCVLVPVQVCEVLIVLETDVDAVEDLVELAELDTVDV